MPTPIPEKLPEVTGRGALARGFRLAFNAINALIEVVQSQQPRSPGTGRWTHNSTGVTFKSGGGDGDQTTTGDGTARWA